MVSTKTRKSPTQRAPQTDSAEVAPQHAAPIKAPQPSLSPTDAPETPMSTAGTPKSPGGRYVLRPLSKMSFLLFVGLLVSYIYERQNFYSHHARLVSDYPSFSHKLGRFTIEWDRQQAQLAVLHTKYWCFSDCVASVWETVPGVAFLDVSDGNVRFLQTIAGHYRVVSSHSLRTTVQTLDRVHYDPVGIYPRFLRLNVPS
eukprot:2448374-Pyramimonas_sp.AAC.1